MDKERMRIVILGSVALPVPPPMQGGTERIAYYQVKGLSARGHEVTLVAAIGSKVEGCKVVEIGGGDTVAGSQNAELRTQIPNNSTFVESSRNLRKEAVYLAEVAQWLMDHTEEYDVILNNMRVGEAYFVPFAKSQGKLLVNVMHLPLFDDLAEFLKANNTPIITISDAQRKGFDGLNYLATVYNGVDIDSFPFEHRHGDYLLMMGSITPHKNQKDGIAVASRCGVNLILAGKIGNRAYFETEIKRYVDGHNVIHVGEVPMSEKIELYKNARALLFPILWEEPFGLVMIEAMACGTPVVVYRRGAVPEVVVDGKTGFVVRPDDPNLTNSSNLTNLMVKQTGIDGLVEAIKNIERIDRQACRDHVKERFSVEQMIDGYENALQKLVH
jgi:glycosyltransferase involved in cell wall biosynthesis